jgi:hypothetical protein
MSVASGMTKAAEAAGLSRYKFIQALARFEVTPLQETVQEPV